MAGVKLNALPLFTKNIGLLLSDVWREFIVLEIVDGRSGDGSFKKIPNNIFVGNE